MNSSNPEAPVAAVEQAFADAVAHYRQGRLEDAESVLQDIQNTKPDLPDVLHLLAMIALQTDRPADAVQHLETAVAAVPGSADLVGLLGGALRRAGRTEDAVAAYEKSVSLDPEAAETHYNLGNALKDLGRWDGAVSSYQRAVTLAPDFADAHYNLGTVLNKGDRFEEAVAAFRRAILLNPGDADAHRNLGNAFQNLGRFEDSIAPYEKALALKPDGGDVHNDLGRSLRRLERLDDAVAAYRRADNPQLVLRCLYMLGRQDAFYDELDAFMRVSGTDREVAALSAFAAHQFGRDDPYPFCTNPLDFVQVCDFAGAPRESEGLLDRLRRYLAETEFDEQESQGSLTAGVQSTGNLFDHRHETIAGLERALGDHIRAYYADKSSTPCGLMDSWPKNYRLDGWYIRMRQSGQIEPHIHAPGWLSGVMYLKMPEFDDDAGSIEFGLHGFNLPIIDPDYPRQRHRVKTGDLVLFPSSLFHRVLPNTSDDERLSLSFDMIPV